MEDRNMKKIHKQDIQVLFINEGAPLQETDDFYSGIPASQYANSAVRLFREQGMEIDEIHQLSQKGIYFMNAVNTPKQGLSYDKDTMMQASFALEKELQEFPSLRVIMLMGDVAKTVFTMFNRREHIKPVIPSGSTYKIRKQVFYYGTIRVFPSYIMTGKNLEIEKSKRVMIHEDIQSMLEYLNEIK